MNDSRELNEVNGSNYLSVSEAAESLNIKETAVRNYLYEGKLTTYKFKGLTLLSKMEIEKRKEDKTG